MVNDRIKSASMPRSKDVPMDPLGLIEAMLFVGQQPLSVETFHRALPDVPAEQFESMVGVLAARYRAQGRPYRIQKTPGGYVMALLPAFLIPLRERSGPERSIKLSRSLVEVLSVVAYRQPIARADVDEETGIPTATILRQLQRQGLVATLQSEDKREAQYVTTPRFLEAFGLARIEDLPSSEDVGQL